MLPSTFTVTVPCPGGIVMVTVLSSKSPSLSESFASTSIVCVPVPPTTSFVAVGAVAQIFVGDPRGVFVVRLLSGVAGAAMTTFNQYRGDGAPPPGRGALTRDEAGAYLADPELVVAVNTALAIDMPLLVTGEPGTGKTTLAWSIASELGLDGVLTFHTRSDHQARDSLYTFDHLRRLSDSQVGKVKGPEQYVSLEALGAAISSREKRYVVLVDEIDKAPRDFPNDLLNVIERREFRIPEINPGFVVRATLPHVVIITSNSERQLPQPFLRRCVFHHISFPDDEERLRNILVQRLGPLRPSADLVRVATRRRNSRLQPPVRRKASISRIHITTPGMMTWMGAPLKQVIPPKAGWFRRPGACWSMGDGRPRSKWPMAQHCAARACLLKAQRVWLTGCWKAMARLLQMAPAAALSVMSPGWCAIGLTRLCD